MNKLTVVLVDETEFFLNIERLFLRDSAVEPVTFRSFENALTYCRETPPALVYLDRGAPGLEGLACCRSIKQDVTRQIPVVMICGDSDRERQLCLEAGCDEVLTKPLDRKSFLAAGRRLLPSIDRREPRIACDTTVFFRFDGLSHYGKTIDLSTGGLFLDTGIPLRAGSIIPISFSLPESGDVVFDLQAEVVWLNTASRPFRSSYPAGAGLAFVDMPERVRVLLQTYVSRVQAKQIRVDERKDGGLREKTMAPHASVLAGGFHPL